MQEEYEIEFLHRNERLRWPTSCGKIAAARFENTIYNKKTAKKHYNRNIHISLKGNPVKHWHLQQH